MDLSKLPKMSQTPRPPNDDPAAPPTPAAPHVELFCRCGAAITPGTKFCSNCGASYDEATGGRRREPDDSGIGAEAWISIALGAILLFFLKRFLEYCFNRAGFDQAGWTFFDKNGATLTYPQTGFYWADLAAVVFAASLILEGITMLLSRRAGVMIGLLLVTLVALSLNFYAIAKVVQIHGGDNVQILNLLAIAFGGYIAFCQYAAYRRAR
jgi:hypothetical protein